MLILPRQIPDQYRQAMVLVQLAMPIRRMWKEEFLRIQLSHEGLRDGEGDFYRANVVQSHRAGEQFCSRCWKPMRRVLSDTWQCQTATCRNFRKPVSAGPLRGVVKVAVRLLANDRPAIDCRRANALDPESVLLPDDQLSAVLLCLDRRYNQKTLDGVYRAAAALCEDMGWGVA